MPVTVRRQPGSRARGIIDRTGRDGKPRTRLRQLFSRAGAAQRLSSDGHRGADQQQTCDTALFGESLIIGTPDEAITMIEDYQARSRVTHLVMATVLPKTDFKKASASLRLFAKEVMPHFRRKARAQPRPKRASR